MRNKNIILIIILIILNANKCDENKSKNKVNCEENNINNYITLQLSCNKDTFSFGDTLVFSLCFINKVDSLLKFYPKVRMLLEKTPIVFLPIDKIGSKLLNDTVDLKKIVDIIPKGSFTAQYKVVILNEDLVFFEKGINEFFIYFIYDSIYRSKEIHSNLIMRSFMFCGHLKSNEIKIIIK